MKTYNAEELAEMGATASGTSFIEAIDVTVCDAPTGVEIPAYFDYDESDGKWHLRITNAEQEVYIENRKYQILPYQRDDIQEERGSDNSVVTTVSVGDTAGVLFGIAEDYDFFAGCACRMMFCTSAEKGTLVEYEYNFFVKSVGTDLTNLTFNLATTAPWLNQFPPRRIYRAKCQFVFKSAQCGYTGSDTTCARTIDACRAKNNQNRIGCFPACGTGGLHK